MRKLVFLICLLVTLFMAIPIGCAADNLSETKLLNLLPNGQKNAELTRAEYAVILSEAAGLTTTGDVQLPNDIDEKAWYAKGVANLLYNNIMRGYPDGTVKPDMPITRVEAVVLLSRVLGLPVLPAKDVDIVGLSEFTWAIGPYTWCVKEGFLSSSVEPGGVITRQEGIKLLIGAFGTDKKGREINAKSEDAIIKIKTMRMNGKMDMSMELDSEAAKGLPAEVASGMSFKVDMSMEINTEQGLHQIMKMQMPTVQSMQLPEMTMEQYYTSEGMFMKMTDPVTGESKWVKYPDNILPDFDTMINQSAVSSNEMGHLFHYRLLEDVTVAGEKCYQVAFYGRINDFNQLVKLLGKNMPQTNQIADTKNFIESMSFMGTSIIDKKTYLPISVSSQAVVSFKTMEEQELQFDSMRYDYQINYQDFKEDILIELPEEALNAEVLPAQ